MSSENQNWVLGVTLGLLGSIAINTGNNIQSLGLKNLQSQEKVEPEPSAANRRQSTTLLPSLSFGSPQRKESTEQRQSLPWFSPAGPKTCPLETNMEESEFTVVRVKPRKSPVQSVTWLTGTVIFVSGSLLNFASYAFAAQSMLASLESVQFVTNLLFGKFMLGGHVVSADLSMERLLNSCEPAYAHVWPKQTLLLHRLSQTQTMLAGTCLTVTGTVMAVQFSSKVTLDLDTDDIKKLYHNPGYLVYLILMGVAIVVLHFVYRKLDDRERNNTPVKHSDVILPGVYAVSSALFGTQSVVQAKVLAELLAVHGNGNENIFESWFTYMTLLIWILTVLVWLKRLNDALKKFNPLFIIPLLQCSFIFFAIISGGVFFQEFDTFDLSQWLGFWFGIIVMFSGLVLLTPKPKNPKDDELHRALVNLLLESKSMSHISVDRSPRSSVPTPRNGNSATVQNEEDQCGRRTPRLSTENIANAALDAVRDVLNGDPSTRMTSEAMVLNTVGESDRRRRRNALERLLELIKGERTHDSNSTNVRIRMPA